MSKNKSKEILYRISENFINFLQPMIKIYYIPNSIAIIRPITEYITGELIKHINIKESVLLNMRCGIQEMLQNAVEHGNLEITYEQKSNMLKNGVDIDKTIEEYSKKTEFKSKQVKIKCIITKKYVKYIIKDQGKGFNLKKIPNCLSNNLLEHGRGIAITQKCFDKMFYNKKGNKVTMIIYNNSDNNLNITA